MKVVAGVSFLERRNGTAKENCCVDRAMLERGHRARRHADRNSADIRRREAISDEKEVEQLVGRGTRGGDADGSAFQIPDRSNGSAQGRRHGQRGGWACVEDEEPAYIPTLCSDLHRIRHGCGSHIDAAPEQRLECLRSSRDLRHGDGNPFCLVIPERLGDTHGKKGDGVPMDRDSDLWERGAALRSMTIEQRERQQKQRKSAHVASYGLRPHAVHMMGDGIMKSAASILARSRSNSSSVMNPASIMAPRRRS